MVLAAAVIAQAAAALVALSTGESVFDDLRLTSLCVLGSMLGAFLAVAVFTPHDSDESKNVKLLALKFAASMICGIAFSPWAIRYFSLALSSDVVIGASAAMAAVAIWIIHMATPLVEKLAIRWASRKMRDNETDRTPL